MALKPEISIPAALATATIVYTVQGRGLPPIDVRGNAQPGDDMVDSVRKQNAWVAAATVAGISLIARDPVVFIVGGAMVVALDWLTRVNNWTSPLSNKVDRGGTNGMRLVEPESSAVNEADYAVS
jgi:hypothetical protein